MKKCAGVLDSAGTIVHNKSAKEMRRSSVYIKWLKKLRDVKAKARIEARVGRLAGGNPGDCRFFGDISEMRIDPGYRVYYKDAGKEVIILLCGGDKTTQKADIIVPQFK